MADVMNWLFGDEGKFGSTYNPQQLNSINTANRAFQNQSGNLDITQNPGYQTGIQWLMDMFSDPEFFNRFEAPLQRQFQEQTIPELANRFASAGSGGALGSTAFRNQLAREGSNLSTNIAALRGGMMQNAIPQLAQYAQQPFNNALSLFQGGTSQGTENVYQPATTGFLGPILAALAGGVAQGAGNSWGQSWFNSGGPANAAPTQRS